MNPSALLVVILASVCVVSLDAQDKSVVLENRKAGSLQVVISEQGPEGPGTHTCTISILDKAGKKTDELTFTKVQNMALGCETTVSGKYVFSSTTEFNVTTTTEETTCGAELEGPSGEGVSLEEFLKIDNPYDILTRSVTSISVQFYEIAPNGKIIAKKSSEQVISDNIYDLHKFDSLPKQNLRLLRNYLFAQYGYKFKSEDLRMHFAKKSWYKPSHDNVDTMLTPHDKEILNYLQKLENR